MARNNIRQPVRFLLSGAWMFVAKRKALGHRLVAEWLKEFVYGVILTQSGLATEMRALFRVCGRVFGKGSFFSSRKAKHGEV